MLQRVYPAGYVFLNLAGTTPAAAGTLYVYINTTTTLTTIYSDLVGTEATNPITLGADGRLPYDVYVNGKVRVRLREYHVTPASGTEVFTKDNQPNPQQNPFYASDFGCVLDGSTADDAAFATAVTAAANSILIIDGPIKFDDNVTVAATVWVIAQGTITMATNKVFTAMLITHEKEAWQSGFNAEFDPRAFGMYPGLGSSVSMTSQLDAMLAAVSETSTLKWPNGVWYFNTKPAVITKQFIWEGIGQSNTAFVANYNEATATNAFIDFVNNGCNGTSFRGFQLLTGTSKAAKKMLRFICDSNGAGFVDVRQCVITYGGGGSFQMGLEIDGSANTTPGGQGYRDVYLEDVYVFDGPQDSGVTPCVRIDNGVNIHGDLVAFGSVTITGTSATAETQSTDCKLTLSCNQTLKIDYAALISINGFANRINMTANASYNSFHGFLTGPDGHTVAGVGNIAHSYTFIKKGTGVIANGATSVAVTHNCLLTPEASQIHVTQTNTTTSDSGNIYVDTITSTQFTVRCRSDPGASTLTFSWFVDATRGSSTN